MDDKHLRWGLLEEKTPVVMKSMPKRDKKNRNKERSPIKKG
jgi:hypothetical protein